MARGADWVVRFKGENRSALAAARGTDQELGRLQRRVRDTGGDFRRTNAEVGKLTRGALAGSGAFRGFARSIAFASSAFLGGAGITYLIRGAISGASSLTEEINKARVVFREGAGTILQWSKTAAVALGIARVEGLRFAGTFGNMLVPMGFARKEAALMAKQLVILAADMASFNNVAPVEILEALRAGLAGETEPLRRFGVFLNEARVQATAASLGLAKTTADLGKVADAETKLAIARAQHRKALKDYGEGTTQVAQAQLAVSAAERGITAAMKGSNTQLTAQQKAAAIYAIILKDTKDAQGDVARTSQSWANVQRRLRATLIETQTALGQGLLPLMQPLLERFTNYVSTLQEGGSRHARFKEILASSISTIRTTGKVIAEIASAANSAARVIGGWENAFKLIISGLLARKIYGIATAFTALAGSQAGAGAGGIALANSRSRALLGSLRALSAIGAITIGINILLSKDDRRKIEDFFNSLPGEGWLYDKDRGGFYPGLRGRPPRRPDAAQSRRNAARNPTGPQFGRGGPSARTATPGRSISYKGEPVSGAGGHAKEAARGYPAVDIFGPAGTPFTAPENGRVVRHSGRGGVSGGFYGWSIYYVGDQTGWEYYFQHMQKNRAPVGRYKKGDVLGYVSHWADNPRAAHVHVGIKKGGARTVSPPATAPSLGPTASPGGSPLTVGTRDRASRRPTGPTPADLQPIRTSVAFIRKHLAEVIPPGLRSRIAAQMKAITDLVTGKVTAKEFSAAGKRLTALKALWTRSIDLSGAIRTVRKQVTTISAQIERMPVEVRGKLRNQMAILRRDLGNVMTTAGLNAIKKRLEQISEAIEAAIEKASEAVDAARDKLGEGWSRFADRVLEVFDAQTDEMVKNARAPFEALTAAEQALEALRKRRTTTERGRTAQDAEEALALATRLGDPAMIRHAQEELEDIRLDVLEESLEAQAEIEREAANRRADEEEKRIRDERRRRREQFEDRLDDVAEILDDENLTTEQKMAKIAGLLEEFDIRFSDIGGLLGKAFAISFEEELGVIDDLIDRLFERINSLRQAQGLPPLSPGDVPQRRRGIRVPGEDGGWEPYARGGVVMRPTRALLGERGPEAVIPLSKLDEYIGGGRPQVVMPVYVNVEGSVHRANDLYRELVRAMQKAGINAINGGPLRARHSGSAKLGQRFR